MAPMETINSKKESDWERTNLRLPTETMRAVDLERKRLLGRVSRNAWILEAIQEKLTRLDKDNKKMEQGNG